MPEALLVSAPVTSFRAPRAREYLETLPVPPPATVYGMLCSLVGEPDRRAHIGAELAVGLLGHSHRSRVLRTLWRVKDARAPAGTGENKRPDFQELLTGVRVVVHIREGADAAGPTLVERVQSAIASPASVSRFGGLSLGESTALVDELRPLRPGDLGESPADWLVKDENGQLPLPIWVDHVGSAGTRYVQFRQEPGAADAPPDDAWVRIEPP